VTGQADTRLLALDRTGLEAAHVSLLAAARYRVCIYLPVVDAGLFESEAALAGLRRIATSGRHARIRLITHDANRAHREGHRLIALAQRLPTAVSIRVPSDETHLRYASAFVTDEASAYLFRSVAARFDAEGDLARPGETSRLTAYFDEVWERAEPAWEIRPLGI